ncbi:hypothetical protein ACLOJK_021973 [Asimina triloba]
MALLKTCIFFLLAVSAAAPISSQPLKAGHYWKKCPSAEKIVRQTVAKAVYQDPGLGAGLIRMHFHDCFVRGCDGSVLLDATPGSRSEKDHPANFPSLRGFEVIDEAKAKLEAQCPKTVSCADILAFSARDSSYVLGGIDYAVPAGRRDGRISSFDDVIPNLPPPTFNATQLRDTFARKGLSLDEMVTLSGAHSIGVSSCSSIADRISSDSPNSIDPKHAAYLRKRCPSTAPASSGENPTVFLDVASPNVLDNKYYMNLVKCKGVLTSDQALFSSPLTSKLVWRNAQSNKAWAKKYAAAMVRMGGIQVLTGNQGEIRNNCRFVN